MNETMNDLVVLENGVPMTDSRTVAEKFGKTHAHVIRDIDNLEVSDFFIESNFGLSKYTVAGSFVHTATTAAHHIEGNSPAFSGTRLATAYLMVMQCTPMWRTLSAQT